MENCDPYPTAPEGYIVIEEKANDCCYKYRIVEKECNVTNCPYSATICKSYESLITYPIDECCSTYECKCNATKCPEIGTPTCPRKAKRMLVNTGECCPVQKCVQTNSNIHSQATTNSNIMHATDGYIINHINTPTQTDLIHTSLTNDLDAEAQAEVSGAQEAYVNVDGGKKGGPEFKAIFHPGQLNAGAKADARVAGQYGLYDGYFGGKSHLDGAANAASDLSYDGGHFEFISKTGGEGGSKVDFSAKNDLAAKADAAASGSQVADVIVSGDGGQGSMTKMIYVPGKISAGADADAQIAGQFGGYGMPGHYLGHLTGKAAAQSDLSYEGGQFMIEHYDDSGKIGDVKASLKSDLDAEAQAEVSGAQEAYVNVDGGKKGGSEFKAIFHPGQLNAGAKADARVAGQYGLYDGYFGGKGSLDGAANAASDLSYDGGHFEFISKTGGEGGSKVDFSAKNDLAAKADAAASGSQVADVIVSGDGGQGSMTKMIYVPGKISAGADADAQIAGQFGGYGMPGHYLGHLTGKAAAQSDLSYEGGQFMIEHYDDSGKIGDVKASLKSDLDAEAQAEVSGAQEAYVNVDGGKKGGSEFKAIFHPGQLNAGAKADARVAGQYGLYDGYFGGKGRLDGAANAASDLSYDGGHFEFISKTGGEGGSKVDFSAKNDLAAKADAAASGSQVADVIVSGDGGQGSMTKMIYVPGKISAGADADAQIAGQFGGYGMPGHYLGHLTGKAAAQSDLSYEGGQFMIEHYDDSGKIGDVKASLKSDLDAEAQAEVSGAQEAYVNVDGGKKGGSEFKAIFHPGQLNAGAKADARVAGQYGLYDGYFGGKGRLDGAANAASDLSYDGGHFEFISKTGGEGGSKVDFSAKNDLAAKADAAASGSQVADVIVSGDEGQGSMTKMIYVPGKISAGADADAQIAGQFGGYGMPGHYLGHLTGKAAAQSDLSYEGGQFMIEHYDDSGKIGDVKASLKSDLDAEAQAEVSGAQEAYVNVDGGKKGGSEFKAIFHPGQLNAGAKADARVAGQYGLYDGYFGGKGRLDGAANAASDLSYDGGHFEFISKTGGEGGSKVDFSAKNDLAAKADAAASGSQVADVIVSGDEGQGSMTKMIYVPGKISAGADADAQIAGQFGGYGMPGHYLGHLTGKAAAQSDLSYEGGQFMIEHYDDSGKIGDVKASLKSDLDAEAQAEVSGAQEAYVNVDGGKKGGSEFKAIFHPGQLNAGAKADARVAGQYGLYDGYFGGKGRLDGAANAASDLSYDGGHFEFISKTGGEGGSKVDFSAKNDLAAKADAAASGSQVADVIVSGDGGQGSMTKMIYVPGKISAGADADAQIAGQFGGYGMPGHYLGHLTGKAAAQSDLSYEGGQFMIEHYDDSGKIGDVKASLKSDLDAEAQAEVSGAQEAYVNVDGGKKGGSEFKAIFHPGQLNAGAKADARVAGQYGLYDGYFGGKGRLDGAANAASDLSYDGGHFEFISKTGGEGGSKVDFSAKNDLAAKADAAASGSQVADVIVSGDGGQGSMTKMIYVPGKISAGADADAQIAGQFGGYGMPGHYLGHLTGKAAAQSDLSYEGGQFMIEHYDDSGKIGDVKASLKSDLDAEAQAEVSGAQEAYVNVDGGKKGGSEFKAIFHPGQLNAGAKADARVAGQYGLYDGYFGGKGRLDGAANAASDLSYDGGHFEFISKTGGEGGSKVDFSAKNDLAAKADAAASGSQVADVIVSGDGGQGSMTKMIYVPGKISAGADADAQIAGQFGGYGMPGHYLGHLTGKAAAQSDLSYEGGQFMIEHYDDSGKIGDVKASLKSDLDAEAQAEVSGAQEAYVNVDGGKKGGSEFKAIFHPGQLNAGAKADARVAGQYGLYDGYFGGKGRLDGAANAASDLSYDGGHFEFISKTGGEGGSKVDFSAKNDLAAKADAAASGSQVADVIVSGDEGQGSMTKMIYVPGKISAGADADAQIAGQFGGYGMPGHYLGHLTGKAAAQSDLSYEGGQFMIEHYDDSGKIGDVKASLKSDLDAEAQAEVSGAQEAYVNVDGGKKGGSEFKAIFHPGQLNAGAKADARVAGQYGLYDGYFGGKGRLDGAANAASDLSYDGGHFEFISKTGGEGGSKVDFSAKNDLAAKADAAASGSQVADVIVSGDGGQGSMTKMIYVPGKISAGADADAQIAGQFGGYGMPGHYLGHLTGKAAAQSDLSYEGGQFMIEHYDDSGKIGDVKASLKSDLDAEAQAEVSGAQEAYVNVDGGKKGGSEFKAIFHPGQLNAGAKADARVAGQYGLYDGYFGGKGRLDGAANAASDLSYDGGHFEFISKTGGEGGSKVDFSAKNDLAAKADAAASGSQVADVIVSGDEGQGSMTKMIYVPGKISAGADADAQIAGQFGGYGMPGHYLGHLTGKAAAQSDLSYEGGQFMIEHYDDSGKIGDVKASLKSDLDAEAQAEVSGAQEAYVNVDGGKKGGSEFKAIFHPGQLNAGAKADARVAGQYGLYDGYFGGKGRLDGAANAASDLSYDGGHFEFISKTGGEGGSKVDFSAKNDLAAKADAAASGSQVADVIVSGDGGQGSMTKMIYVPGKISAGADADAQIAGQFGGYGMPGHYLGHLTGKAAAQSDLSYEGGQFMIEHYDDSGKIGDVKASLKSDLDAEAQAEVSGAQEAYVNVDGGKKGGSEFKAIFHPGQLNAGAKADARVAGQYGLYDGYFGGKGRLDGAANAASDLSYDGGHFEFISKTGGEGGSKVDFSAKNDLAAKADAAASGSQVADVIVSGDEGQGSMTKMIYVPGKISAGADADAQIAGQFGGYGMPGHYLGHLTGKAAAQSDLSYEGGQFMIEHYDDSGKIGDVKASLKSDLDAEAQAEVSGAQEAYVNVDGGKKGGSEFKAIFHPGQLNAGAKADARVAGQYGLYDGYFGGKGRLDGAANAASDLSYDGGHFEFISKTGGEGGSKVDFSAKNDLAAKADAAASGSQVADVIVSGDEGQGSMTKMIYVPGKISAGADADAQIAGQFGGYGMPGHYLGHLTGKAAAQSDLSYEGGQFMIEHYDDSGKIGDVKASLKSDLDAEAQAEVSGAQEAYVNVDGGKKGGSEFKAIFHPGQLNAGAKADARVAGQYGLYDGYFGGKGRLDGAANAASDLSYDGGHFEFISKTGGEGGSKVDFSAKNDLAAKADAAASGSQVADVIVSGDGGQGSMTKMIYVPGKISAGADADAQIAGQFGGYGMPGHYLGHLTGKAAAQSDLSYEGGQFMIEHYDDSGKIGDVKASLKSDLDAEAQAEVSGAQEAYVNVDGGKKGGSEFKAIFHPGQLNAGAKADARVAGQYGLYDGYFGGKGRLDGAANAASDLSYDGGHFEFISKTGGEGGSKVDFSAKNDLAAKADAAASGSQVADVIVSGDEGQGSMTKMIYVPGKISAGADADAQIAGQFGGYGMPGHYLGHLTGKAAAQSDLSYEGGQFMIEHYDDSGKIGDVKASLKSDLDAEAQAEVSGAQEAYVNVDGGKKGGSEFKAIFHPGQLNAGAKADARVAGQYGLYDGYFGGKGRLDGAANAASDLSYDGGHFEFISKTGGEGGSKVDFSAKNDLAAKADAAASGSQVADVIVSGDEGQGSMTKMIYVPGKISAGADADAQIAGQFGGYGMPGHYLGHLTGKAAAQSDLSYEGGQFMIEHYDDSGKIGDVKASLKSDLDAEAQAEVSGAQEAYVNVDGGKKGGSEFKAIFHPGQLNAGAKADARVAGQYGLYDGYFGGKGRLDGAANAASDLSYDGGHFEFISKTGGEGGSKVDFSAKNDLAAKADAAASGSQVADVIVSGDGGQGSMTKMIYVPGKISAGADADAQIAGQFGGYGMPGHYLGHLTGKAAAQSDLSYEGGQFMIEHYDDSGKIGDVKASLKSDLDAEAQAEVSGAQEAYVNVDGGKKGGSEFKAIFHPGQLNAGAKADARVAGQYGLYDGYFGGKGRLDGAANAASDLSYDGGHFEFISKTGGEGGSKVDFSAKNDLAAKADAAASGSQVADVIVSGDEGQGSMTKMIYVPGKISAGADADAQIAGQFGGYGMPGHYLGHLTGKAAAQSDLSYEGGQFMIEHYDDSGKIGDVKASLKSDLDAEAQAEVSGAQEAYVNVDGGKKGGSEFKAIFHPGQLNAGAKADARVAGQYGLYDGYFGGKGRLDGAANAASDLSYDGGHFEFISKTGGEGGSKVDFSAKNDLAAKADAAASGSQVADVIVSGDEGQGSMTKMIYVPGKISAGADADAQIAGQFGGYGMPGHYLGHLTGKAAAQSDLSYEGGQFMIEHYDDSGKIGDVKASLKSDLDAEAQAEVSGAQEAYVNVDGGKKGGSEFKAIFHPGQLNAGAKADARVAGQYGLYDGYFGGKGRLDGAANAASDLSYDGGDRWRRWL